MKTNTSIKSPLILTHEGGRAVHISPEKALRRNVMANMLWEGTFYEDGVESAQRIADLVPQVQPVIVASIAADARNKMHLRHVPLLIAREMCRHKEHNKLVGNVLESVIQRPDEISEFVALYWKDKKQPLTAQAKKGLAKAFLKFSPYSLAKYNRKDAKVKLRDVMFLVHPKPTTPELVQSLKQLADGTLPTPDTWEVELSKGGDKTQSWDRLITERKLGGLATLRNLRNMSDANVPRLNIITAIEQANYNRVLPFRFIAAAKAAPQFETPLENALLNSLRDKPKLRGTTAVVLDVSGSMFGTPISAKSDLERFDAGAGVMMVVRERTDDALLFTFSDGLVQLPDRHGFPLIESARKSQPHGGTRLAAAVSLLNSSQHKFDNIVVITDEQAHDGSAPVRPGVNSWVINVAAYRNGVGYGAWNHIDGWSEAVVDFIIEASTTG